MFTGVNSERTSAFRGRAARVFVPIPKVVEPFSEVTPSRMSPFQRETALYLWGVGHLFTSVNLRDHGKKKECGGLS